MRQNRFLESVLNSLSDGLIIVDKNSKIIKVTPKISNWFGQSNKKLIGQDVFDFIEPIIRNTKKKRRDVNSPLLKNERVVIIALS